MKKIIKKLQTTNYRLPTSRGFTLIETLTALLIFSSSIVVLITATSGGFSNTNYAKNKLIASFLAQEGVEVVRNMRDSDGFANLPPPGAIVASLSTLPAEFSNFSRTVLITGAGAERKITSTVTWSQGVTPKSIEFVEYLFDWQ